jgi:hypothetical protein
MRSSSILMLVAAAIVVALALAIHLFGGNLAATLHGR